MKISTLEFGSLENLNFGWVHCILRCLGPIHIFNLSNKLSNFSKISGEWTGKQNLMEFTGEIYCTFQIQVQQ